ncbi:alpha/beta fold hydrolase [Streptomyces spiramyceticus]|uniref:alpha/beta fold hydrolase n=1 Tax=Streptomyces spiramyceticus TaxID=299717 RepID=UPI00237A57B4|nr:alpha/beta hydrolase [Streptomyces spiramyceticus]
MSRPPTFTPPPGTRALTLRTSRGTFAALEAGPLLGEPRGRALLLPGYTGSKEDFIAMLVPLAQAGYRVVAVDGLGQYESEGPEGQASYAQGELARDVLAQAEAVGGPVHLVGHSLGGQIARAAVLKDPAPFASLTLMSSGSAQVSPAQQQKVKMLTEALATLTMDEVWDAMQALDPPEDTDTDSAALRARWLRHNPTQLIATGRQLTVEPDRVAELAAVPMPVHVVSGVTDDTWPVPLLDDMAERLHAHRTVIEGAQHSPNTDRPEETAKALVEFWDRQP